MNGISEILIIVGGVFNLGFVLFHIMFWRVFHWKEDLASLTHINRSVMQIMNLCLIFIFLVMAYVSFFHRPDLLQTGMGKALLVAFSGFWFLRMIEQVIFFGMKKKISVILTLIFLGVCVLYLVPFLQAVV